MQLTIDRCQVFKTVLIRKGREIVPVDIQLYVDIDILELVQIADLTLRYQHWISWYQRPRAAATYRSPKLLPIGVNFCCSAQRTERRQTISPGPGQCLAAKRISRQFEIGIVKIPASLAIELTQVTICGYLQYILLPARARTFFTIMVSSFPVNSSSTLKAPIGGMTFSPSPNSLFRSAVSAP